MWILSLKDQADERRTDYRQGYFPRKFSYKKDAVKVQQRLKTVFKVESVVTSEGKKK